MSKWNTEDSSDDPLDKDAVPTADLEHTQLLAQVSASIAAELDLAAADAARLGGADARARLSAVAQLRDTLASSVRQQLLLATVPDDRAVGDADGDADGAHRHLLSLDLSWRSTDVTRSARLRAMAHRKLVGASVASRTRARSGVPSASRIHGQRLQLQRRQSIGAKQYGAVCYILHSPTNSHTRARARARTKLYARTLKPFRRSCAPSQSRFCDLCASPAALDHRIRTRRVRRRRRCKRSTCWRSLRQPPTGRRKYAYILSFSRLRCHRRSDAMRTRIRLMSAVVRHHSRPALLVAEHCGPPQVEASPGAEARLGGKGALPSPPSPAP